MIQNLNQMSFQGFGTVLPERTQVTQIGELGERKSLQLNCGDGPVFCAEDQTYLACVSGNCVLSVSLDGEEYRHFYLDKLVCVKTGVYFALTAPWGVAGAEYYTQVSPRAIGTRNMENLKVERKLKVEGIYTFFYHEKEQGFLFAGESHPMAELTYVDQGALHSVADGVDMQLKQGEMVFYQPGQWHMQYADIGVAPRVVTASFTVGGGDFEAIANRKIHVSQKMLALLQQMLREAEYPSQHSSDMILSLLQILLILLLREGTASEEKLQSSNSVNSENEIVRRAMQHISTHVR